MGFGKANYSGGGGTNFFVVKAGEHGATGHNIFRILPAYGKLETSGKWYVFFGQHFGYRGLSFNGEGDGVPRTFKCIREVDRKSKMTTVECPECLNREGWEKRRDKLKAQLIEEGKDDEQIKASLKKYNDWLKSHNLDKSFYLAAMNQKGEFGVLKLKYEAKDKLDKKIKALLAEEQIDATAVDQGVWFDFQRTGEYLDTSYDVDVVMDTVVENGKRYKTLKQAPLSVEEQNKALATLPELVDLPRVITEDQIRRLVACSGDPAEVDAIMGIEQKKGTQERAAKAMIPPPEPGDTVKHVGGPGPSAIREASDEDSEAAEVPTAKNYKLAETDEEREFREFKEAKKAREQASQASKLSEKLVSSQAEVLDEIVKATAKTTAGPSDDFLSKYGFKGPAAAGAAK
jgi:hypothetical protein